MVIPAIRDAKSPRTEDVILELPVSAPESARPTSTPSYPTANELLSFFVTKALEGDPHICTYGWAYRKLFNLSYERFSQAYAQKVITLARQATPQNLPGLGPVRLDTFIVSKDDRLPSTGHWSSAAYDREDWERVLGNATLLD